VCVWGDGVLKVISVGFCIKTKLKRI
jgi:hypothetical protein